MLRSRIGAPSITRRSPIATATSAHAHRRLSMSAPRRTSPAQGAVMYAQDATLPTLPVPTLQDTATRYLKSLEPFHTPTQPTASSAPTDSFATSQEAVKDLLENPLVQTLQERLIQRSKELPSWLAAWWDEAAYFGWRGPVVPGVNYFYVHKDDKARRTGPARAAGLVRSLLFFRRMCNTETLEPEMVRGKTPLAMSSYRYLFNASRIPTTGSDTAKIYPAEENNHIVVVRKNKFYQVPVVDAQGEFLSEKELEAQFKKVVELAGEQADPNPLGALTTADRDVWTKARQELLSASPENVKSLEQIEAAIIVVSLDSGSPITREEMSYNLWVGDGKDRWFDKHQLIVFENGRSGFNGEHSCMDGTPTSRLNDWLLRSLAANKVPLGDAQPRAELPAVRQLEFSVPGSVVSAVHSSIKEHAATMGKHDLAVLQYDGLGKDNIKKFKISPDSYTQLVMQLAYYKMTGQVGATYESAQTRKFKLGRTEVIRSVTSESLEWCKAMENPAKTNLDRLRLLQKAGQVHAALAGSAADGQGVDRHLFGLKKVLKEGEKLPKVYEDPTFAKSSHWVLSTSQLSSEFFDGWGYGEVVDDGYGLAYSVNAKCLRFTITSMNRTPTNGVLQFRHFLEEACQEVKEVMEGGLAEEAAGAAPAQAKL